jgi:hypothetical protein
MVLGTKMEFYVFGYRTSFIKKIKVEIHCGFIKFEFRMTLFLL